MPVSRRQSKRKAKDALTETEEKFLKTRDPVLDNNTSTISMATSSHGNDGQSILSDDIDTDTQPPNEDNTLVQSITLRTQQKNVKAFIVPASKASNSNCNDSVCHNSKVNDGPTNTSESIGISEIMTRPTFIDNHNILGKDNRITEALNNHNDDKNKTNHSFDSHVDIQDTQMPTIMRSSTGSEGNNFANDKNVHISSSIINQAEGNEADITEKCHYNSEEEPNSMSILLEDDKMFSCTGIDIQKEITNSLISPQKMPRQPSVIEDEKDLCFKETFHESGSTSSEMNADIICSHLDSKDVQMDNKEITREPVDINNTNQELNMKRHVKNGTKKQDIDNSSEENCIIPLKFCKDKPKLSDISIARDGFQANFLSLGKEKKGSLEEHSKWDSIKAPNVTNNEKANENSCTVLLDKSELLGCAPIKTNVQLDSSQTIARVKDMSTSYVKANECSRSNISHQENQSGLALLVNEYFFTDTDKDAKCDGSLTQTLQSEHVENISNEQEKVLERSLLENASADPSLIRLMHLETSSKECEPEFPEQNYIEDMTGGDRSKTKNKGKVNIDEKNPICSLSLDMDTLGDETPAGISLTIPTQDSVSVTVSQGFEVTDIHTPLELSVRDEDSSQPFIVKDTIYALEKGNESTIDKDCGSKCRNDKMKIIKPCKNDNEDIQNMVTQKYTHPPFCDGSSETNLQYPDLNMNAEKTKNNSTIAIETINQSRLPANNFQEDTNISESIELEDEIMNEISDSQLCEVSRQSELEQKWQETRINTVKQFEKRKKDGQRLLNVVLKEIKSINVQVLKLKREIEMAKFKMGSTSTETKLNLSKPAARRQAPQTYGNGRL